MKIELEQKLAEEFPFLRRAEISQEKRIGNMFQASGCECGDGWYELLRGLFGEIVSAYEVAGIPVDIVVDQIKEKFGTLRFYYHFEGRESVVNTINFSEQGYLGYTKGEAPLYGTIEAIVAKWEKKSTVVCEKCGKPGKLRKDHPWVLTLCDDCDYILSTQRISGKHSENN